MERYAAGDPGPAGTIKVARFTLGGESVMSSDSFIKHPFTFTPSFSLMSICLLISARPTRFFNGCVCVAC
jgi:predicted 3-demethylubiquinone-9 3-methyltransferase (glyoxalase superfamily)